MTPRSGKLKPCPFCGKLPIVEVSEVSQAGTPYVGWSVGYNNHKCTVWTVATGNFKSEVAAIAAWNRRKP